VVSLCWGGLPTSSGRVALVDITAKHIRIRDVIVLVNADSMAFSEQSLDQHLCGCLCPRRAGGDGEKHHKSVGVARCDVATYQR
jgi:hypothetical protein